MNSPRSCFFTANREISAHSTTAAIVDKKQNRKNFVSHTSRKCAVAICRKSMRGSATWNTNRFI